MPDYQALKDYRDRPDAAENYPDKVANIAQRLLTLRHDLHRDITRQRDPQGLIVASWNIRDFDHSVPRLDESFHYIAEIISAFDICAIQEVRSNLNPLKRLVSLLGPSWDYFVSDVSTHKGGNNERAAIVFNRNKVFFRKVIGEIVLPDGVLDGFSQPARSPLFAAFQAGWFRFTLCTVHIAEGRDQNSAAQNRALRAAEISAIGQALTERARTEDEVFFLLGDMNIEKKDDEIMAALQATGMNVPDFGKTNVAGTKYFDHIAYTVQGKADRKTHELRHGRFDWRNAVFGPAQPVPPEQASDGPRAVRVPDEANIDRYVPLVQNHRARFGADPYKDFADNYQAKMTWEMSDHLPVWVEVKTDFSDEYLESFLPGGSRAVPTG